MFGTHDLLLFIAAGLLLNVTPGPDMLYVMGRSSMQGSRAGFAAALGIGAGCFVHIIAGAVGLSALLAASATAFIALKIVGAIYLCYVGLSMLLPSRAAATAQDIQLAPVKLSAVFMQGFLTNALNPKVALFFLAFVPQFISTDAVHKWLAFLFLGAVFNVNGTLWNIFVAWLAARAGSRLRHSAVVAWLNRCIGAVFVFVGIRLAFAKAG
jgi:threonine/homoserine/homoserine lactone efflux protein